MHQRWPEVSVMLPTWTHWPWPLAPEYMSAWWGVVSEYTNGLWLFWWMVPYFIMYWVTRLTDGLTYWTDRQTGGPRVGLLRRTVSVKFHPATNISHSTRSCESKNTWVDQHQLHLGLLRHCLFITGITTGNEPKITICSEKHFLKVLEQFWDH